jgi:GAF domain-containing protein
VPDPDPFRSMLAALSRFYVGGASVQETLHKVALLGADCIPGADLAGITMLHDGRPVTAVFTDLTSPEVDRAQYESGEGPCLDAYRFGSVNRVDCMETETRWPAFAAACREHGLRSTLSLPLGLDAGAPVGALNFYSRRPEAFPPSEDELPLAFAESASAVLANAQAYWEAYQLSEGLSEAMRSRAVIEQAKGVLMAQSGFDSERAIEVLKRASQRENRKLRDIAADIVAGVGRPRHDE